LIKQQVGEGEREDNKHGGLYLHSAYCERKRFQKHGGSETCEPDGTSAAGKFTLLMLILLSAPLVEARKGIAYWEGKWE